MGCDGGTIPKRDELVRTKKKPEQVDKDAETVAKWKHCAISQEELRAPIVSCELGRLYNKDSVIEFLLDKSSASSDIASHIRNMKDIIELKLTPNPTHKKNGADMGDEYVDRQTAEYICPVTGIEMSGRYNRFVFPRLCGCVVSKRALNEIKSDKCHRCGQAYEEDDLIVINGTNENLEMLTKRMNERRLLAKQNKKAAKRKSETVTKDIDIKVEVVEAKKSKKILDKKIASTSASSTSTSKIVDKKLAETYSVAKDPAASEAFKSLFTSHKTCQNQQRAHWVTYNPLYN